MHTNRVQNTFCEIIYFFDQTLEQTCGFIKTTNASTHISISNYIAESLVKKYTENQSRYILNLTTNELGK